MAADSGGWSWGAASWARSEANTESPGKNQQGWTTKSAWGSVDGSSGSNTVSVSGAWDLNQSPWKSAGGNWWASQGSRPWGSPSWGTSGAQGDSKWWQQTAGNSGEWSNQAWAWPSKDGVESPAPKRPEEISSSLDADIQKPEEDAWNKKLFSSPIPRGEQEFMQQPHGSPQYNEKPLQQQKPYHQDEWYQKWLKRQNHVPPQEPEMEPEKPQELEAEKKHGAGETDTVTVPPTEAPSRAELGSTLEEAASVAQPAAASELDERLQAPAEQKASGLPSSEQQSDAQSPPLQEEQQGKQPEQAEQPISKQARAEATMPEAVSATVGTETQQTDASAGSRKEYENEEWYQKWLRRQQNKNRQIVDIGKPQEPEKVDENSDEKRVCPDDGKTYTFKELMAAYSKEYNADDLKAYWRTCKKEGEKVEEAPKQEEKEHPHQHEEWYQKWLRRQQNKNRQIIEIGKPAEPPVIDEDSPEKRLCPDDGKKYTFQELKVAYGSSYKSDDLKAYWRDAMKVISEDSKASAAFEGAPTAADEKELLPVAQFDDGAAVGADEVPVAHGASQLDAAPAPVALEHDSAAPPMQVEVGHEAETADSWKEASNSGGRGGWWNSSNEWNG
mmetsp:Transcript_112683/g.224121  ORF Transcript_112683/g.224121 Transcript_112683/m.224121 type:complete len:614 (+) Transcript_112683:141-1982(+)|eukprot:CAMPEP_0172662982 /NCGR_PEP_ID=MMETSP1074-20121228/5648_1 /TAXON_ID=2916 /ORGANISM="Ceratium fusus, Strain PA161109" /LENGTH=613 /DNA_ID=CAMNT_0013478923 /DNA_START=109 /DNA_END=1950 /DNA_ORIENTATION=-